MDDFIGALTGFVIWACMIGCWLTAVLTDAMRGSIAWVIVDVLVAPIGVIRGALILAGVA